MHSVKGTMQIRDVMFFYFINFLGAFHSKRSSYASQYIQIYLFSWQLPKTDKISRIQCVTNSELTKLVPVSTIRPAFPTSVKKVNTSFKNFVRHGERHYRHYWRTSRIRWISKTLVTMYDMMFRKRSKVNGWSHLNTCIVFTTVLQ